MKKFTNNEVLTALREAVEEKGDEFIYTEADDYFGRCTYSVGGAPSCLVGHAIAKLNPTQFARVVSIESEHGSFPIQELDRHAGTSGFTEQQIHALAEAQGIQDLNGTWGTAFRAAEDILMKGEKQ